MSKFNIEDVRFSSSSIDDFMSKPNSPRIASTGRVRVASLSELSGFSFIAEDTLVRLSQQDFWKLGQDDNGHFIERLVDDSEGPIRE